MNKEDFYKAANKPTCPPRRKIEIMSQLLKDDLLRLKEFTKKCRPDMHEPDEQDIYAQFGPTMYKFGPSNIVNTSFDNACTAEMSYDMGFWLIRREYYPDRSYKEVREWFNLAVIVALARMAKEE